MKRTISKRLPLKEFMAIYKKVPRLCVDAVIRGQGGIVFVKRDIEPWKGMWHIPGGTVRLNERLEEAIIRIIREETGLTIRVGKPVGSIEYIYREGHIHNHSVSVVFLGTPIRGVLRGNAYGRDVQYLPRMPRNTIPVQKRFLTTHRIIKEERRAEKKSGSSR